MTVDKKKEWMEHFVYLFISSSNKIISFYASKVTFLI